MMHSRIAGEAEARPEPARYNTARRIDPLALAGVVAVHAGLLVLALTYRFTMAEPPPDRPLVVQTLDLTPPPPTQPETPPETSPVFVPKPPVILPLPQAIAIATTPEPPPVVQPPVQVPPAPPPPAPAPAPPAPISSTLSAGDLFSTMIEGAPPRYPTESRRQREQGTVVLTLLLGTDGRVADIRVSRSSGYPRLDEAALRAVRRWRWSPTVRNGAAVQVRGTVEIPFILAGTSAT